MQIKHQFISIYGQHSYLNDLTAKTSDNTELFYLICFQAIYSTTKCTRNVAVLVHFVVL
uniref:Uncharacterized protein n=1 Tax=Setaria italica TaxID=4555 RepID=K3YKQ4_SETIT